MSRPGDAPSCGPGRDLTGTTIESAIRIRSRREKEGVLPTDTDGVVILDRAGHEDASAT